jgi:FdhD protein
MQSEERNIHKLADGEPARICDRVAIEEPLEIRVRGRAICVTMRTPGHDEELAAGFLVGEGIVSRASDVVSVEPCGRDGQSITNVVLAPDVAIDFGRLTRYVYASSSCGVCGKATLDSIATRFEKVASDCRVDRSVIQSLPHTLRRLQETFATTGGLHAAGVFDLNGNPLVVREDVGRHNAVDKAIGWALLGGRLPLDQHVLLVSGRASFEIVQKALGARVPVVCAISAPSTLAIDLAQENGQTLVGFVRDGRMNVYTHPQRINA